MFSTKLILNSVIDLIKMLPLFSVKISGDNLLCIVAKNNILKTLHFVKNFFGLQFKVLTMISGTDYPSQKRRFEVSYELLSLRYNHRLRIKSFVYESDPILSAASVFLSATWWEREIWDLFGLFFKNNPDLRRILTDYGFLGHPLRKDFPLTGFSEIYYDTRSKTVSYNFVEISQKQRLFVSYSPNLS